MTPTHDNDSPGNDSQEHGHTDHPIPIPPPRRRRAPRLRTVRFALRHRLRPARLSTVWPCVQDDLREGTGVLADWLLAAIIKIVTTYTQPGQRVLLLDPVPYLAPPMSGPAMMVGNQHQHSPYTGLREAGWTVVRLGRGIQTRTALAHLDPDGGHTADALSESESGPGLRTESPSAGHRVGPSADWSREPDSATIGRSPDCYDLIITAADPRTLDWFHPTDWAGSLTSTGTLAIITRSDCSGGRLVDPAGSLVCAAVRAGLRYLDRIALLHVPVRDGALAVAAPTAQDRSQPPSGQATTSVRHIQVHEDLLVFTRQPALIGTADAEETSDD